MKKKTLALMLVLLFLLTACGNTPTAPTYTQNVEIDGTALRVGQYRTEIPDEFYVADISDDDSVYLVTNDNLCIVGITVLDVSDKQEAEIGSTIAHQRPTTNDPTEIDTFFSDMPLKGYLWVELDENFRATGCTRTTFTDSWYLYQINVNHLPGYEDSDVVRQSFELLVSFKADGIQPRFDFVQ